MLSLGLASQVQLHQSVQHRSPETNIRLSYSISTPDRIEDGKGARVDICKQYNGDGSTAAGWPAMTDWVSFGEMFTANIAIMKNGCSWLGMPSYYDTQDSEVPLIREAIQLTAAMTGVDHRFVLAITMQESLGCVRVYTTFNANENPGLMQNHAGSATCNSGSKWAPANIQLPCPYETIVDMIQGGVGGTPTGDGLAAYLNLAVARMKTLHSVVVDGRNAQIHYQAARQYNSGSVDVGDLSNGFQSTKCYASDVANRLTGWAMAPSTCHV